MIRKAARGDRDRVVAILKDAHDGHGFGALVDFSERHVGAFFDRHFYSRDALVLVLDVDGVIGGVLLAALVAHPSGPAVLAKDSVWWIGADYRGPHAQAMLDRYETWAKERGAVAGGIAGMGEDPRIGMLLRRRGYAVAETVYLKRL